MVKRLAPVLAGLALCVPVAGYALGLGNITMNSALNQPLDAEIELLSVQSGDLDNLVVRLGAAEDFERVGADRSAMLTRINFAVATKPDGTPYVKMTTTQAVTEPFLDFVVEARWPRGRILREFTVLVDPPVLTDESPAQIRQAAVAPQIEAADGAIDTRNQDFFRRDTPSAPVDQMAPIQARPGELAYGPVKYKDTLWAIADAMKPAGTSTNQMMVALLRQNPQAFYNGNVNQLKAGFVLRVKDNADVTAISVADGDAEIARQRADWVARRSGQLVAQADTAAAGQVDRSGTGGQASGGAADAQARVKLVAPGSTGAGSGAGTDVAQLQQDLLLAAEALDANRQESEELKTRLKEMEEQLAAMQNLITLKDAELAQLQNQAGAAAGSATTETAPSAQQPATAPAVDAQASVTEAEAPKPEKPARAAKAEKPEGEPEAGIMDRVMNVVGDPMALLANPMVLYGGLGIIALIGVGVVVMRRRRMQGGFEESILNIGNSTTEMAGHSATTGMSESSMVSDFAMSEMSGLSGIQADASEVDPISEADVYLAYGRHQQAQDILKDALKANPNRNELKLKLLEVYFAAKNREAFEQTAQDLHDSLGNKSSPLWAKAVTMGAQLCPGSDLFGGASVESLKKEMAHGGADEDLLDFDFDFDTADFGAEKPASKSAAKPAATTDTKTVTKTKADSDDLTAGFDALGGDDSSLDIDFNMDSMDSAPAKSAAKTKSSKPSESATQVDHSSLDFDVSALDFNIDLDDADKTQAMDKSPDFDLSIDTPTRNDLEATLALDDDMSLDFEPTSKKPDLDTASHAKLDLADSGVDEHVLDMDLDIGDLSLDDTNVRDVEKTQMINLADLQDLGGDDVFGAVDEVGTKLDLARAYVDMGDSDGARGILNEVMEEGNANQKSQARELLAKIG